MRKQSLRHAQEESAAFSPSYTPPPMVLPAAVPRTAKHICIITRHIHIPWSLVKRSKLLLPPRPPHLLGDCDARVAPREGDALHQGVGGQVIADLGPPASDQVEQPSGQPCSMTGKALQLDFTA